MYSQINGIYFSHTGILSSPLPLPDPPTTDTTTNGKASAASSSSSRDGHGRIDWNSDNNKNLPWYLTASTGTDTYRQDYDVFLSFSGQDSRLTFTGHLKTALTNAGFSTYFDEERLEKAEAIRPGLMGAIEGSKISIVVLSRNYANSTWCLDELVKIMVCRRKRAQMVLPIFFGVEPTEVRKQRGPFAEAFREHEVRFRSDREKVLQWRSALREATDLNGWEENNWRNKADLISDIVRDVSRKLQVATNLAVARYPVGIDSRVKEIKSLLKFDSYNLPSGLSDDKYKKDYDVFLCFRGADTRHTFTVYLYTALTNAGFSTFMDLEVMEKGEEITPGLLKAIQRSKISIVISLDTMQTLHGALTS